MVGDVANTTFVNAVMAGEEHQHVAIDRRAANGASLDVASRLVHFPKHRHPSSLCHEEKSRRVEYNRPTLSPCWFRGAISGNQAIALARCRKETCSLSLMSALRVNSGTGAEPKDHVVRGGPGSSHADIFFHR